MIFLLTLSLRTEADIVNSRKRARQIAALLSLPVLEQTQIATAVSEAARNAVRFAGGGQIKFYLVNDPPYQLRVEIEDQGPGMENISLALEKTGGLGLKACYRLSDRCEITSVPGRGTKIALSKNLAITEGLSKPALQKLTESLLKSSPSEQMDEVKFQNTELILTLEELIKQRELSQSYQLRLEDLNKELADTNRGVIALNLELEEQARAIRVASEVKERFLSHVTHEFRTPVNSILSMSRILLTDGHHLSADEQKQMNFIRKAAEGLSDMVNDLLDSVKADAKKLPLTLAPSRLSDIFDTLRAMFRPLLPPDVDVKLEFEVPEDFPVFVSDETKISQILRNFISNALKFTISGKVSVRARIERDRLILEVEDTGIGIHEEDQGKIFEEFYQVPGAHQKRVKGTGLGLPLARKFARLLGGEVTVRSAPGKGSIFALSLPFEKVKQLRAEGRPTKVLVIDDDEASHINLRNLLQEYECEFAFALDGEEGLKLARAIQPDLIVLDVRMPGLSGREVLALLRQDEQTKDIPVFLNSSLKLRFEDFQNSQHRPDSILQKDELSQGRGLEPIIHFLSQRDSHV